MFTGRVGSKTPRLDLSGQRGGDRKSILKASRDARVAREKLKLYDESASIINRAIKGFLVRKKCSHMFAQEWRTSYRGVVEGVRMGKDTGISHLICLWSFSCGCISFASMTRIIIAALSKGILVERLGRVISEGFQLVLEQDSEQNGISFVLTSLLFLCDPSRWGSFQQYSSLEHPIILSNQIQAGAFSHIHTAIYFYANSVSSAKYMKLSIAALIRIAILALQNSTGSDYDILMFATYLLSIPLLTSQLRKWGIDSDFEQFRLSRHFVRLLFLLEHSKYDLNTSLSVKIPFFPSSFLTTKSGILVSLPNTVWLLGNLAYSVDSKLIGPLTILLESLDIGTFDAIVGIEDLQIQTRSLVGNEAIIEAISLKAPLLTRYLNSILGHWPGSRNDILNSVVFSTEDSSFTFECWCTMRSTSILDDLLLLESEAAISEFQLFCDCLEFLLLVIDDDEFYSGALFPQVDIVDVVLYLNTLIQLFVASYTQVSCDRRMTRLFDASIACYARLRDRQSRRAFTDQGWLFKFENEETIFSSERASQVYSILLERIPFVFLFSTRVALLHRLISTDKIDNRGRGRRIQIRREYVMEDSMKALQRAGSVLKGSIQIEFVDEHGMVEAGIDGGGLFKEFLTTLCSVAFNPDYDLFSETDGNFLYPNPSPFDPEQQLQAMRFLGMVLGKALYDGILVEPQFANFFLRKLLGQVNLLDDLGTLDPELYRNLMFLKRYSGDFEELALSFYLVRIEFGEPRVIELLPGGKNIPVTRRNRLRFIHLMADYKLNRQIKRQCTDFVNGLSTIVDLSWLRMFSSDELQALISGSRSIDLSDWRKNTNYTSGYHGESMQINWFWEVVESLSLEEQSELLKFCTSCSRAPLLGFKVMNPLFCVQRSGNSTNALPTSSTCVNLLKLPEYPTKKILREKLIYALSSRTGFHLT